MSQIIVINYEVELIDEENINDVFKVKGRTELKRNDKFLKLKIFFEYVNINNIQRFREAEKYLIYVGKKMVDLDEYISCYLKSFEDNNLFVTYSRL